MLQNETFSDSRYGMTGANYEVRDGGRTVGWVLSPESPPQAGPGAATVLLTRRTDRAA
jgi:hypothetical protein